MKDILRYLVTFKFWKELFIMTLGMMIAAAAVYYFMIPSKLVLGSISGLSIVISNLFGMVGINVKVSLVVMVINAILLLLAWLLIGKEFGAKTVYTAMILGPMLDLWEKILKQAKKTTGYNPTYNYGLYQIKTELNTAHVDADTGDTIPDYPELNGNIETLASLVKDYYLSEIVPNLFKYEFLK